MEKERSRLIPDQIAHQQFDHGRCWLLAGASSAVVYYGLGRGEE